MKTRENLSGKILNNREVLKIVGILYNHSLYEVKCLICGNVYQTTKANLLKTKNCSNCAPRKLKGPFSKQWKGGKIVPMNYWNSIKHNARARNIAFTITLPDIEKIFNLQEGKCKFTGEKISFEDSSASLDRINSNKGYIKGNVQWVHKDVNLMKNNRTEEDFINYCIKIHQYSHQPKPLGLLPEFSPCTHKNFKGVGYVPHDFYTSLRRNAESRHLSFTVSLNDLNDLFVLQSGKCNLTGENLFFKKHYKKGAFKKQGNASIDRIDNTKGYDHGNIRWVDKTVNMIKYTLTQNRFFELCRKITKKFTTVVAISGYFQITHSGHINYITEARKLGGYLIAIVNSDKQASLKSTPCIVDEKSRAHIISNIRGVDETVIAIDTDGTVSKTLELIKPHIFCNGGDRTQSNASLKEQTICENLGIQMIYNVGGGKTDSSSGILQRAHKILSKM